MSHAGVLSRGIAAAWDMLRRHGWGMLLGVSLGVHALVVLCFWVRWDRVALITIVPFLFWCVFGLVLAVLSLGCRRTRPGVMVAVLWVLTFTRADELHIWANLGTPAPLPASAGSAPEADGHKTLRLVSFNTHLKSLPAAREVLAWNPDIVFLQEAPPQSALEPMARELFGAGALVIHRPDCAILARGRALQLFDFQWPVPLPGGVPWAVCARLTLPDGRTIDLLNVHLLQAETSARFWTRQAWRDHAENRRNRRFQLALLLSSHQTATARLPRVPLIVAGDFNAPAKDGALFALPGAGFRDSYTHASGKPGNTFPNNFPIQRIDQCWLSPDLIPLRHGTSRSVHSDHRMVIVDMLYPAAP